MDHCPFSSEFNSYVELLLKHYNVPSVSIGVVSGDDTFTHSYGDAHLSTEKATEDTLYPIASVTKSFTAATLLAVLQECENKVNLGTKISSILAEDFVLSDEYATKYATLEDALTHVLGVSKAYICHGGPGYTTEDALRALRHLPMSSELRERYNYLNMGYVIVQRVIETLSGLSIVEAYQKYIWEPLGMLSTVARLADAQNSPSILATGYSWDDMTRTSITAVPHTEHGELIGDSAIISSTKDMTKYLYALLHGQPPLSSTLRKELLQARVIKGGEGDDPSHSPSMYAMGWIVSYYNGHCYIRHGGLVDGFSSVVAFLPHKQYGVAIHANSSTNGSLVVAAIRARLMDTFLGVKIKTLDEFIIEKDKEMKSTADRYFATRTRLYKELPDPVMPPSLPLVAYAGTYSHPAYRTLELVFIQKPKLKDVPMAEATTHVLRARLQRLTTLTLDLEHVSGDYFISWLNYEPARFSRAGSKAQFELASNGQVAKCGIDMELRGRIVWFTKV
ncbi:hypothetical protein NLG97_g9223 [Lecanicillium saksenae]|uniref:Uncharacterized protein n=1 Tax=Lecanicillium saksenae TaxID=468837 RepID=A0ACC1QH55_9HYPO|nr:hypothetical protein NLG97_g9223 [Lecanicillium saksenae]